MNVHSYLVDVGTPISGGCWVVTHGGCFSPTLQLLLEVVAETLSLLVTDVDGARLPLQGLDLRYPFKLNQRYTHRPTVRMTCLALLCLQSADCCQAYDWSCALCAAVFKRRRNRFFQFSLKPKLPSLVKRFPNNFEQCP